MSLCVIKMEAWHEKKHQGCDLGCHSPACTHDLWHAHTWAFLFLAFCFFFPPCTSWQSCPYWPALLFTATPNPNATILCLQLCTSSECPSPASWGLQWESSGLWTPTSARTLRWTTGSSEAMALGCLTSPPTGAHRRVSLCWGRSGALCWSSFGKVLFDFFPFFTFHVCKLFWFTH